MVRPSISLETASGSRSRGGIQAGRDRRRRYRLDAFGSDRRKPFRHLVGEQPSPGALRELLAQRHIGQRIERVVEIDQQLAPLHAVDIVGRRASSGPAPKAAAAVPASSCSMTMSPEVAR